MKYDRIWQIKKMLLENKKVSNAELCKVFDISIETVRRDLNVLEREGIIKKVYGGAILLDNNSTPNAMQDWNVRFVENAPAKAAMAKEVVRLLPDNCTIGMDSGTSVWEVARLLSQRKNLTILTNSLHTAVELGSNTTHLVYCIGGAIKNSELITTGLLAMDYLDYFSRINIAVVSADGFNVDEGLTDYSVEMGTLKKLMIEKASRVIAVVDHSKFNTEALYLTCATDGIDVLVTDSETPKELVTKLKSRGIEVIVAQV